MATVFLSYDHDDVERAAPIATALEKAGHSVWWDRHIHGGAQYNDEIEAAVEQADAVVVLWSNGSVRSTWVRDEAAEGRDQNKLVPVLLDAVKPPMGFRQFQTIDLTGTRRGPSGVQLQQLLNAIDAVGGATRSPAPAQAAKTSRRGGLGRSATLASAAAALLAMAALAGWTWYGGQSLPTVSVAAGSSTDGSQTLARDLFVKLGMLEHVGAGKWQLADPASEPSDPDLLFRVAEAGTVSQLQANLLLVDAKEDSLLWSREFAEPGATEADVRQQVSLAAGLALVCSLEAREDGGLTPDLTRRYLASCVEAALGSNNEPDKTVAAMRSIVAERPGFKPAWSLLLGAQTGVLIVANINGGPDVEIARRTLIQDIEKARNLDPDLPAIAVAEIDLLSPMDFAGRLGRIAKAKSQAPGRADLWGLESSLLERVGHMSDAIASARRAAELDPLAPQAASSLIMALARGGRLEEAKKELALMERKWAGTGAVKDTQWAFHLRHGDPKIAYALRGHAADLYLQARLEPIPANINAMVADIGRASKSDHAWFGYAIQALGEYRKTEEVFGWLNGAPRATVAEFSYVLFRPALADARWDPRFMAVAKRIGLLDFWQKRDLWPDFCYEPDLPYDCRKEAAKLAA